MRITETLCVKRLAHNKHSKTNVTFITIASTLFVSWKRNHCIISCDLQHRATLWAVPLCIYYKETEAWRTYSDMPNSGHHGSQQWFQGAHHVPGAVPNCCDNTARPLGFYDFSPVLRQSSWLDRTMKRMNVKYKVWEKRKSTFWF